MFFYQGILASVLFHVLLGGNISVDNKNIINKKFKEKKKAGSVISITTDSQGYS